MVSISDLKMLDRMMTNSLKQLSLTRPRQKFSGTNGEAERGRPETWNVTGHRPKEALRAMMVAHISDTA